MCETDTDHGGKLVFAGGLVLVGVLALFLLHVLGTLRRSSSHKFVHAAVLGTYALSYLLVSYTLGLMQDSKYYVNEFPVWAVSLLMLLGGTDNLMACNLSDIDSWKSFQVKHLIKGVLVVGVVAAYGKDVKQYRALLWAIIVVNALQSYVRITSMRMASKEHLLWKNVKPIADYMKRADKRTLSSGNPVTMEGYRYVVSGENRLKSHGKKVMDESNNMEVEDTKITTVEEIWRCEGKLLCSNPPERGLRLKDVCLSMALSKMLHRKFAGFELVEANLQKTKDFVFKGLLFGENAYKRVFRVIEVELGFVYDLYFTRYPYLYYKGWVLALCFPVVMVILCAWLTYKLYETCKIPNDQGATFPINTTLTLGVMAMVTFLEAFQLYLHLASGWFKVALIQSYVTKPALHGCLPRTIISLLLRLEAHRPWENKLGQYSLLQSYDCKRGIFLHYASLRLINKAMKGCKRGKPEKLSVEVKQAVVASLVTSKGQLTNGKKSLETNGVDQKLTWDSKGKVTQTILVWHIATTICKQKLDAARSKQNKQLPGLSEEENAVIDTNSKVASSLSQYCAYLVAFAPDLLPGHSFDSVSMLEETINGACELLKGAKTMEQKCDKLESNITNDDPRLVQGARLARQLTEEIQDMKLQWKVLSDFWAEMILYVAPCDDALARAHLEALTRGGEFITLLWALLTHAGVLERDPAGSEAV